MSFLQSTMFILETNLVFRVFAFVLLGLNIGSFLNVVIYRLPIMIKRKWRGECAEFLADEIKIDTPQDKFNLSLPASHCPQCHSPIKWWNNIPLISYVLLRGKCSICSWKISPRYFMIELLTGVLFGVNAYVFTDIYYILVCCVFIAAILCLVMIDFATFMLPDEITLPLVWFGILVNLHGLISGSLINSVLGAVIGYLSLWSLFWIFKIITKKDGLGYGDFKILAAIGAFLGVSSLITVLLFSSIVGICYAIIMRLCNKLELDKPIPFGPFLGIAAIFSLFFPHLLM